MRTFLTVSLVLFVLLASGAPVSATSWYIKDDGTGDAASIGLAISSAAAGDTILLAAGTFFESGLDILDKPLVIQSESGPDVTTIDCTNSGYGILYDNFLLTPGYVEVSGISIINANILGPALTIATCHDSVLIENNTITNSTFGIVTFSLVPLVTINNNRISGCTSDGMRTSGPGPKLVTNNEITGNGGDGIELFSPNFLIDGNTITGNSDSGIQATVDSLVGTISNNVISGNLGPTGGLTIGGGAGYHKQTISSNLISDNNGIGIQVHGATNDSIYIANNTFYNTGLAIANVNAQSHYVSVTHNIISFGSIALFSFPGVGTVEFSCNDIFGNADNSISGIDLGDNFSEDPVFCDAAGGDFGLSRYSPCLVGACGQVGAFGLGGCLDERPYILSLDDVGNDQGGQIRLSWEASSHDTISAGTPVLNYGIYRRQDAFFKAELEDLIPPHGVEMSSGVVAINGWDFVGSVPARTDSVYQTVLPTLCDSTIANGDCWSTFFVSATTASPGVFWDSAADSGYSVDNLVPAAPAFVVEYNAPGGNELTWPESEDPDVAYYNIYRTLGPALTIGSAGPVHSTSGTSWTDPIPEGWQYSYTMTTVDHSGNESGQGSSSSPSGVGTPAVPNRYALHQNAPNPFNPTTKIRYDVPQSGGGVTLNIYDVSGRRVRTLVDGPSTAGAQTAIWDGRDDAGRRVASGVYFFRLQAPGYQATRKGVLIE